MIRLLDDMYQKIKTFRTDVGLFYYLLERIEELDEQEQEKWQFARHPYKTLAPYVEEMEGRSLVDMARQACQKKKDIFLICKGDVENPFIYLATPDLDIMTHLKEWNKLFCDAHKLHILTEE